MTFGCLYLSQKTNENISVFLPYISKIGQIKKRMQVILLEWIVCREHGCLPALKIVSEVGS